MDPFKTKHMNRARILPGFWLDRLNTNGESAIFHQWEQLEASGCIQNFRIVVSEVDGFRSGWFFADSDAYKWLDAAARIIASHPNPRLESLMDDFIDLVSRAQMPDGYLYTYNQIHFPETRWANLQIEHELYCHGHLIEAGVSHHEATGHSDLLNISCLAADRIVADFMGKGPKFTPGHQEIEIALLRLFQITQHSPYLEIARQFIEQRGRNPFFSLSILKQNAQVGKRGRLVQQLEKDYLVAHPGVKPYQLPPGNEAKKPPGITLRWMISALSGKYFQQHSPVRKQNIPVGHSVRFAYLETAIAMLARTSKDRTLIPVLEKAWEHMVSRRMYVTGGIGSLPALEGFGNDFELDPEIAYTETCAALACMYWNWEMAQLTGEARYSDLFEWQLYNAAAIGMGLDGKSYFYNNPLTCRGGVTRQPWYAVPCCPSNLSRTYADLGKYVIDQTGNSFFIHQYISSQYNSELADFEIQSGLPWDANVTINVTPNTPTIEFPVNLRIPSWSTKTKVVCNGEMLKTTPNLQTADLNATGFDPYQSRWLTINRIWKPNTMIKLEFDMPIQLRHSDSRVKCHQTKIALTRGPLVYCLESIDNPDQDIFGAVLEPTSLEEIYMPDVLGGIMILKADTTDLKPLILIPYHLWGNRGESTMNVWVNI
jgi:DUF1680 family protein